MIELFPTPALDRLTWILGLLNGASLTEDDVREAFAPAFLEFVSARDYVAVTRARCQALAPVAVVGVDVDVDVARARVRSRDGQRYVVACAVDPAEPHRIVTTWVMEEVPPFLGPRLPAEFAQSQGAERVSGERLVVLSGVPGTGKSTLGEALSRELRMPVFAGDWLLGALTPFGGYHLDNLLGIAEEQLTTLALRQLELGQSAILDFPTEDPATRQRWNTLADRYGARLRVITCICSDPASHRERGEQRQRSVPGWHDAARWDDIQRRIVDFPPWPGDTLTLDATRPLELNLRDAVRYIRN